MKKSEIVEGVILLLSAILLLLIMAPSDMIRLPPTLVKMLSYALVIVLGVIFVRRLRRIVRAFRENKNRPGSF